MLYYLFHVRAADIVGNSSQHKDFPRIEADIGNVPVDQDPNHQPIEAGNEESCNTVGESDVGHANESDPPEPEDGEIILVEQVV